jgi:hypothetical protein
MSGHKPSGDDFVPTCLRGSARSPADLALAQAYCSHPYAYVFVAATYIQGQKTRSERPRFFTKETIEPA